MRGVPESGGGVVACLGRLLPAIRSVAFSASEPHSSGSGLSVIGSYFISPPLAIGKEPTEHPSEARFLLMLVTGYILCFFIVILFFFLYFFSFLFSFHFFDFILFPVLFLFFLF